MIKGLWRALYSEVFAYFLLGVPGFNAPQRIAKAYGSRCRAFCGLPISLFNRGRADILFCGVRFSDLTRAINTCRPVKASGGVKELYLSLLGRFGYFCSWGVAYRAYKIFLSRDELALEELVRRCEKLLQQWGIKVVVVMSDSLPLERIWILAARRVGVRSICIQHGLFSESGGVINDGKYADVMAAYDQYQVDILKRTGALNPVVFGFYENVRPRVWRERRSVVCILGQPWAQYYEDKGDIYKGLLSSLVGMLSLGGARIVYKPHPGEIGVRNYVDGAVEVTDLSLDAVFDEYDVFLSFTSTALFEATLAGKLSIQIFDERLSSERFSEMGYAHTVQGDSLNGQLLELIRVGSPAVPFSDSRTVAQRFLALMEDHCL